MNKYFLEIREEGERLPVGNKNGYATLAEAETAARMFADDALPRNRVMVFRIIAAAGIDGAGEVYVSRRDDLCP